MPGKSGGPQDGGPIRLLLINPRLPESFWSLRWWVRDISGRHALNPPLGLATLAALCPSSWQVTIIDENVEPIPTDPDVDIVGIGGMGVQLERQRQLLQHYRGRGYYVVAGGSFASLCPDEYAAMADTVVAGEAEYIWPRFCADYERGAPLGLYHEQGTVDLRHSPVPRFDLLKLERYSVAAMQFSRGCPFRCEFCDVIVMFGRKPRHKSLQQVEQELDALRVRGVRNVFFVDDNLIGHPRVARELLEFLEQYQIRHGRPFEFGSQLSVNLAEKPDLLELCVRAGLAWVFVGIETPDRATLEQLGKSQNTRMDLLEAVRRIHAHGIDVLAGFIVGFDADDQSTFARQLEFIRRSGIQVAMVGLLMALPHTPLYERLSREGRLRSTAGFDNTKLSTNVVPAGMSVEQLVSGYQWLYEQLTSDRVIGERVRNKLRHWRARPAQQRLSGVPAGRVLRMLGWRVLRGGWRRVWHFSASLASTHPRAWPVALSDWVAALSMRDYWERHLAAHDAERLRARCLALGAALRRFGEGIAVNFHRGGEAGARLLIGINRGVELDGLRLLGRRLERLLRRSRITLCLQVEGLRELERQELRRLLARLARHADRIIVDMDAQMRALMGGEGMAFASRAHAP